MAASDKKLVRSKSGLRMISVEDDNRSPFTIAEPEWVPDKQVGYCMNAACQSKFDLLRRRHHCRRCGKCHCKDCCSFYVPLPRMCFIDPVRHCEDCSIITKKENEFFDKHLKTLLNGAEFVITESGDLIDNEPSLFCLLSSDCRVLTFEGNNNKSYQEPVTLEDIESIQILANSVDQQGNTIGTGVVIRYKSDDDEIKAVKMAVARGASNKTGLLWVAAIQKAFKMIYEKRTSR